MINAPRNRSAVDAYQASASRNRVPPSPFIVRNNMASCCKIALIMFDTTLSKGESVYMPRAEVIAGDSGCQFRAGKARLEPGMTSVISDRTPLDAIGPYHG